MKAILVLTSTNPFYEEELKSLYEAFNEFKKIYADKLHPEHHKILIDTDSSFKDIEKLRSIIFLKIEKENLLAQIKEAFGYGGLIHLYKNYVLTKDENFYKKI